LVNSKNTVYDRVVVIWQGRVVDYKSENTYMLTNESLKQICGTNTFFSHVSCGYGLFPPAKIQALSPENTNWGKMITMTTCQQYRSSLIRNKIGATGY
jgi:hypothetical protein